MLLLPSLLRHSCHRRERGYSSKTREGSRLKLLAAVAGVEEWLALSGLPPLHVAFFFADRFSGVPACIVGWVAATSEQTMPTRRSLYGEEEKEQEQNSNFERPQRERRRPPPSQHCLCVRCPTALGHRLRLRLRTRSPADRTGQTAGVGQTRKAEGSGHIRSEERRVGEE